MSSKKLAIERKQIFGDRVKAVRKHFRLAQNVFAQKIGSSAGFISEVENGLKMPGTDVLISLRQILHVNINWLITGIGEMLEIRELGQSDVPRITKSIEKARALHPCDADAVCKQICDICKTLNNPSERAVLKMMEGLQSESDFKIWQGQERRKKA